MPDTSYKPLGLTTRDNRRPVGVTLLTWSRRKPTAWDVTIPDSFIRYDAIEEFNVDSKAEYTA